MQLEKRLAPATINLGAASSFAVLQMGGSGGQAVNNTSTVNGLEGIGPGGTLVAQKTTINGQLYVDSTNPSGSFTLPANQRGGQKDFFINPPSGLPQIVRTSLAQAVTDARNANTFYHNLAVTTGTSLGNFTVTTNVTLAAGVYQATARTQKTATPRTRETGSGRRFRGPAVRTAARPETPGHRAMAAACFDTICHATRRRSCRPATPLGCHSHRPSAGCFIRTRRLAGPGGPPACGRNAARP
jgi:hypothetical protein